MTDQTGPEAEMDGAGEGEDSPDVLSFDDGLAQENALLKDQVLRLAAEMENLKRRSEREANDARAYAIQRFARDLLGVADNLQRALQHAPRASAEEGVAGFLTGVELTEKELLGAFERNGLKRLAPEAGEKFDPNVHQAMMEQASDSVAGGAVISTLQTGYELFGRVVRPALVVVAAKGSGPKADASPYAQAEPAGGAKLDTRA